MAVNIFERIEELKGKPVLTLAEIDELCNECTTDSDAAVDVAGDIIQFSDLTEGYEDLTNFTLPNSKETWIAVAQAVATEVVMNRPVKWTVEECAWVLKVNKEDVLKFLQIKQYITKYNGAWHATGMGVDFGCVENRDGEVLLTKKGFEKVQKALTPVELSPEERKRIDAICAEAEKKARYNGVGKAE